MVFDKFKNWAILTFYHFSSGMVITCMDIILYLSLLLGLLWKGMHSQHFNWIYIWRAQCKNGLSDDFGPTFTKPPNYLLSCNVTVAKWIVSCSQHIVLVIWIEFPPKLYQVTLLLARKVKLPKCQEIPIISAGGKKQFCCCPCSNGLPRQEKLFQKLFILQNGKFCFTGNSQLSHLFRLATPSLPGSAS